MSSLVVVGALDRELESLCVGTLTAVDAGSPPRSSSLDVIIRIIDANDNSPTFGRPSYNVTVREDLAPGSTIVQVRSISFRTENQCIFVDFPLTSLTCDKRHNIIFEFEPARSVIRMDCESMFVTSFE